MFFLQYKRAVQQMRCALCHVFSCYSSEYKIDLSTAWVRNLSIVIQLKSQFIQLDLACANSLTE